MASDEARYFVSYYVDGKDLYQDEHAPTVPAIGTGVHFGGEAYRVDDVCINYEKHAPVSWGVVVFLKRSSLGTGFREVDPAYYGAEPEL